jgi:hypothetical protein
VKRPAATACALALAACSARVHPGSPATTGPTPDASFQRACVAALEQNLAGYRATRMDEFLSRTLSGLVYCESRSGLAYLPPREVSFRLQHATGRPQPAVTVPTPPAFLGRLPQSDAERTAYQRACMAWARRFLPAHIANAGDDRDTAAADTFDAIEECDGAAGFATIPHERFIRILQSKKLS